MSLSITLSCPCCESELYWRNITHNVAGMAKLVGCYDAVWRSKENGIETAGQLIKPLTHAMIEVGRRPEELAALNPSNGWGDADGFAAFVQSLLEACTEQPKAKVSVCR